MILLALALMPMLTSLIPAAFPMTARGYSPVAYQLIFASIAGSLAVGLAFYLTSRDAKPSGTQAGLTATGREHKQTL